MNRIFTLLILSALLGCRQPKKDFKPKEFANVIFYTENPAYTQNVKDLLNDFKIFPRDTQKLTILFEQPIKFNNVGNFLQDSTSFTPFEIEYIQQETDYLSHIKFKNNLGPKIKLITNQSLDSIFVNHYKDWSYFQKKYGQSLIQISHPIFLKNNTTCILYLVYMCGGLCGEEQIRLYKKIKGKWTLTKTGYGWIS